MFKKLDLQKTLTQVVFKNINWNFHFDPGQDLATCACISTETTNEAHIVRFIMRITHIFSEIMICGIFVGNRCIYVTFNQVTTLIFIQIMPMRTKMFLQNPNK